MNSGQGQGGLGAGGGSSVLVQFAFQQTQEKAFRQEKFLAGQGYKVLFNFFFHHMGDCTAFCLCGSTCLSCEVFRLHFL